MDATDLQVVRLMTGAPIDVDLVGARTVFDVRYRVAEAFKITASRIELLIEMDLQTNETVIADLPSGTILQTLVVPQNIQLPEERLAEVRKQLAAQCVPASDKNVAMALPESVLATVHAAIDLGIGYLGEAPHIPLRVSPVAVVPGVPSEGFVGYIATSIVLEELHSHLCKALDVPLRDLTLLYEGRKLDIALTIVGNEIGLPGPVARKRGAKLEFGFCLTQGAIPGVVKRIADEHAMREGEKEMAKFLSGYEREGLEVCPIHVELPAWWKYGGIPRRYIDLEVREFVQTLVDLSEPGPRKFIVDAVILNEDPVLWMRYCARKTTIRSLPDDAGSIDGAWKPNLPGGPFGDLDQSMNEGLFFRGIDGGDLDCLQKDMKAPREGVVFNDTLPHAVARKLGSRLEKVAHSAVYTSLLCRVTCGRTLVWECENNDDNHIRAKIQQCEDEHCQSLADVNRRSPWSVRIDYDKGTFWDKIRDVLGREENEKDVIQPYGESKGEITIKEMKDLADEDLEKLFPIFVRIHPPEDDGLEFLKQLRVFNVEDIYPECIFTCREIGTTSCRPWYEFLPPNDLL